ncbi:Ser/Thr protein phosphatase [Tritrichomonas foetus]|uniref:Serine/threonine-protein phosphatase n=1 Tax=Tritrichomonas foetus TaxID=1144522 RepID=A0A1J4J7V0_9EUKA|nr:Ser/Thr protein phosphatase [Tritrichomonas foetus]|eukprot:OHS94311.1 Ser/Thr protein phosphatase [Tritrichomonas foetus]
MYISKYACNHSIFYTRNIISFFRMLSTSDLDEIVFQVLLGRMHSKKQFLQPITEKTLMRLVDQVSDVLAKEPVMLRLDANITVVGDIHGNIDDLLRIFERLRYPPAMKYLFLGDYVDRGNYSTEVLTLLFALKVKYPNHVYLLRGNHETMSLSRVYGFYREITSPGKYTSELYYKICEAFEELPLCAIVGDRIFCVHGGISPLLGDANNLLKMKKPEEDLSSTGVFADMVWSDPSSEVKGYTPNGRGCGYLFGSDALAKFLDENNLDILIRSHEMCQEGVSWPYADDDENVDRCLTVFSNSNYCGRGNSAAVLHVNNDLLVNVELIQPLTDSEMRKRKVLLPFWLYDLIALKESEKNAAKTIKSITVTKAEAFKASPPKKATENMIENL